MFFRIVVFLIFIQFLQYFNYCIIIIKSAYQFHYIKNVLLKGLSIVAIGTAVEMINVGGVVGYNEGTVAYCGMAGVIAGETVNGSINVGGIAGCNLGEIYCCYAAWDDYTSHIIFIIKSTG